MKVQFDIPFGAEKWVDLNYNGKILPRYSVTDYGRIYDNKRYIFLPYNHQRGLYWYAPLTVDHSKCVSYAVHRAVLLSFNPISNFRDMQVNHIDGNPQNNMLSNLEWASPYDNTHHAINTGLRNQTGMNNGRAIYTDETIHQICKLIDEGYGNAEIATKLGYTDEPYRGPFCSTVSAVRYGRTRRDISTQYKFMSGNTFKSYSQDFAYLVCNFLSDPTRNFTYNEIADFLQIPQEERMNFKIYVNRLIMGKEAKGITEMYDLKKPIDYYDDVAAAYARRSS